MKQFEAGDEFLKLVLANPKDFTAVRDTGRDHDCYIIRNNYRAVSVCINVSGGNARVEPFNNALNYIRPEVVQKLVTWAEDKIEEDKIQAKIDRDNEAVNLLTEFYSKK